MISRNFKSRLIGATYHWIKLFVTVLLVTVTVVSGCEDIEKATCAHIIQLYGEDFCKDSCLSKLCKRSCGLCRMYGTPFSRFVFLLHEYHMYVLICYTSPVRRCKQKPEEKIYILHTKFLKNNKKKKVIHPCILLQYQCNFEAMKRTKHQISVTNHC